MLEAAGLKPVVVDVSSYAIRMALGRVIDLQAKASPGTLSVLFRLGASATTIQVLRGQDLVYEREQSVGGAQLTQKISNYYGLSLAEVLVKLKLVSSPNLRLRYLVASAHDFQLQL